MDMGYDLTPVYEGSEERSCHPIIPLRETPAVKAGKHRPPTCEHGEWTFAGSEAKRQVAKWRCPTGECAPARSRLTGCTPSSPAGPTAGRSSTGSAARWSGRTGGLRTSGRCCRYGYAALSGSSFTRT